MISLCGRGDRAPVAEGVASFVRSTARMSVNDYGLERAAAVTLSVQRRGPSPDPTDGRAE